MLDASNPLPIGRPGRMIVRNDRLWIDGNPVPFRPTKHVGGRIDPRLIVIHDTASRLSKGGALGYLLDNPRAVSAHFVIERDGTITQTADCDVKTNHAGESGWQGRRYCNGFSIGIEIVSPGSLTPRGSEGVAWFGQCWPRSDLVEIDSKAHGGRALWLPYTAEQIEAVAGLVKALAAAYPSIVDVRGHFEVSPGRKVDPGPHFPLDRMRAIVADRTMLDTEAIAEIQRRLQSLGYYLTGAIDGHEGVRLRSALRDFQEQNGIPTTGELNDATIVRLLSHDAKPYPTGAREAAAEGGAAAPGSETVASAAVVKRSSESVGVAEIADAVTAPMQSGESLLSAVTKAQTMSDQLGVVIDWLGTPRGIKTALVIALAALTWRYAGRIEWGRIRDFVTGRK